MYTYKAQISRIIDGDSVVCLIDLGFSVMLKQSVRLFAIDTAETRGGTPETKALSSPGQRLPEKRAARRLHSDAQDLHR